MTYKEFKTELLNNQESLQAFSIHLSGNTYDAGDLIQETYFKALKNKNQFLENDRKNLRAWLFTIMKNTFINNYRKNKRRQEHNNRTEEKKKEEYLRINQSENPESRYKVNEISGMVEGLSETYRRPFILYLNGYKYKEIAEILNLNLGTVKSRIFLSRKKLRNKLNR